MAAGELGAIDVVYAARGRLSRIYLLDAALEALIVAAWVLRLGQRPQAPGVRPSIRSSTGEGRLRLESR